MSLGKLMSLSEFGSGGKWPIALWEWSRREDLNAPSADYGSAALTLSYTGI